ncbi:ribonuclease HII [Patescibacteria group bacterium]
METYNLTTFEKELWDKGLKYVAGIDEVGRGCLAGPMVVCAVILNKEHILDLENLDDEHKIYSDIKDSKLLTPKKRLNIRDNIINEVISYSLVEVPHNKIDSHGITQCTKEAFYSSVKKLNVNPHHILTDNFEVPGIAQQSQTNLIRGDNKSITVAAASIIAKVYRDDLMVKLHEESDKYKVYRFDKHKGYGTALHREMIHKHGRSDIHRKSFKVR